MVRLTGGQPEPGQGSSPAAQAAYRPDDASGHAHRQLIGYIGLVLPILLILIAVARDGIEQWRRLESISAYYYTGAVTVFAGMLVALALFLLTYRGYRNKYQRVDRAAAITAAIAALGVAFFPTAAPAGMIALPWWSPISGIIHHICAVVLFVMFAVFALWLFRITPVAAQVTSDKQWRNRMYFVCGLVIVASVIWAAIAGFYGKSIFLPESVALAAFAISWLVKGYAHRTLTETVRSLFRRQRI